MPPAPSFTLHPRSSLALYHCSALGIPVPANVNCQYHLLPPFPLRLWWQIKEWGGRGRGRRGVGTHHDRSWKGGKYHMEDRWCHLSQCDCELRTQTTCLTTNCSPGDCGNAKMLSYFFLYKKEDNIYQLELWGFHANYQEQRLACKKLSECLSHDPCHHGLRTMARRVRSGVWEMWFHILAQWLTNAVKIDYKSSHCSPRG